MTLRRWIVEQSTGLRGTTPVSHGHEAQGIFEDEMDGVRIESSASGSKVRGNNTGVSGVCHACEGRQRAQRDAEPAHLDRGNPCLPPDCERPRV